MTGLKEQIRDRVKYYSSLNGKDVYIYKDWYLGVRDSETLDEVLFERLSEEEQRSVLENSNIIITNDLNDLCDNINLFMKDIGTDRITNSETKDKINAYLEEINKYKNYNTCNNYIVREIVNKLLTCKNFYESLNEKQFADLEYLQKTNLGYEKNYGTQIEIHLINGKYSSHSLVATNLGLYKLKTYSPPRLEYLDEIDTIVEKKELDKIKESFNFHALRRLNQKIHNFLRDVNDQTETIYIKNYDELVNILKKFNIYEDYKKEEEQLKQEMNLLNNPNLIEVEFSKYRSWETGGKFLILKEKVKKDIFAKLMKAGMYYHYVNQDNEEIFTGYCVEDTLENNIKLAKLGLKVKGRKYDD